MKDTKQAPKEPSTKKVVKAEVLKVIASGENDTTTFDGIKANIGSFQETEAPSQRLKQLGL